MAGTISFSGLSASGIDSSAWVDALVSTKQQTITTLQEQKEAQENLLSIVNDIKSYFTSFQSCLAKLTDAQYGIPTMDLFLQNLAVSSNTNIATATATVEASRQSYDVLVDQLATATKANSGYVQYEVKRATLDTQLGVLGVTNGTVTVNSQSFSLTTEDTIKDLINKFDSVGVSANFDEEKGVFTVGVGIDEIDEGATNLKSALKLSDNNIDGAVSGSLVYVTRDTEFSKLGLTGGRIVIEDKNFLIVKNGDEYTISDDSGVEHQMDTVGDFFDYLMSSAVNAEEATVDDKGNIVIKGAKIDSVEFGSNLLEVLNLTETNDRTVMESQELSYNKDHVADLTTQLSSLGITDTKTLVVGGTTHNITSDKTLGDIKELLNANGVDFDIDDRGVITVDTKGNEISGTLLDALGLDPTKGGSTITSTPHLAKLEATGDTLLSELGVDDSMSYVAYKSDGTAVTTTISGLSNKTVDELIADLKAQGVNASFDSVNHQILIDDGYIEGTLADQLGMSKSTTTYTESATLNTTLEKLGSSGNETLTIDGGAAKTYGKDTTLQTILDDITAAGGNVTFKDGNVTISGVTLGGSIPGLLGLEATTQGSSVTSGELTITTGSSSSGGDLDETVEHDITLSSKIGDILGTTNDYTLKVENGNQVTYTKDTTLQTLKDQIEAAGGIFRINEDNTITIDGVTMSGTLVGALGFESVENGTRFSTVNPVMVEGSSNTATGGTSLGQLGLGASANIATFGAAPMAAPMATPMAAPGSLTLSIDGGAEIIYDSTTTLDDIFADIQAAGGKAYIDSDGYIIIEGVNLSGTLVDALGLQVTSYGSTITSGNIQVATSTTSTSSSELVAEGKGNITWDSTIGSITDETISYDLSINGNSVVYDADTKLSDIKTAIENAGGTMTINSDNTITIKGVSASGSLMDALGFDVTDYKTTISSNMPIYAIGEDKIADETTSFDELGIDSNLRDYAVYLPDGTVVKASSTDGSSGTKTIGDWLDKVNSALNTANGTSGVDYAQINNGVITITGGYVDGSLATALGIGKETIVTDVTLTGQGIQYVEYKPLEYITSVRVQEGESAKDVSHNGSIGVNQVESGTASSDINSSGFVASNDTFEDLFGNIDEATLKTTLAELLNPDVNDPLNNDATLKANSYTLKIGTYAEKTFDARTTTLEDLITYIENLKTYDPTYDRAFDASYVDGKFTIKSDMAMSGTLLDALGFHKVGSEIGYYTYTTNKATFTDLIEKASNGFNFSIIGGKVQYEVTDTVAGGAFEYTGEKVTYETNSSVSSNFINSPTIKSTSTSKVYVSSLSSFSSGSTYYIKDSSDLTKLASLVNSGKDTTGVTFILENDIDMSGLTNFTPIGDGTTQSYIFKGNFYGNGHVIKNLTINQTNASPVGLFGYISNALIQDVGLENVNINAVNSVGALVGWAAESSISNSYVVNGTVSAERTVGGLIGYNSLSTIEYAYADVVVTGDNQVGGFVGFNEGEIRHSYSTSEVTGKTNVGGFAGGIGFGSIYSSYSTGNVSGDSNVGGFIGKVDGSTTINITNSYSSGAVSGSTNVGSFIGYVDAWSESENLSGVCLSTTLPAVGKFTINEAYIPEANYEDYVTIVSLSLEEMQNQSKMESLGFTSANGWQYTSGTTPHFTTSTISTTTTKTLSPETKIGDLFDGSTASQTLNLTVEGGSPVPPLTFSSTDTVQDVIDKLAEYDINATVTTDGRFKVTSDSRWTLSGALASKLFGGSGNEIYTYEGHEVTYTTTTTTPGGGVSADGFITTPTDHGGGDSSGIEYIGDKVQYTTGNVANNGFIKNPTIQDGSSSGGSTITKTEYYYQGTKITYSKTNSSYASYSTKLVDLLGSGVIGTSITIEHFNGGGHSNDLIQPDLGMGSGSSGGIGGGSITTPQHMGHDSESKTITIDANTTIQDIVKTVGFAYFSYDPSTGKFTSKTQSFTDGCRGTVSGSFVTYLDNKYGTASPSTTTDAFGGSTTTRTWRTQTISSTTETFDATASTTLKDLMGLGASFNFDVTNNGTTSNLTFSSSDTIQTVINKLKTLGLDATFDNGALKVSSSYSDFQLGSGLGANTNIVLRKLFGGTVPARQTETSEINFGTPSLGISKSTTLGELGITSGTLYKGFTLVGQTPNYTTFTSSDTLGDVIDYIESGLGGSSVTLNSDGTIYIESGQPISGTLLDQLGLTAGIKPGTSPTITITNDSLTYNNGPLATSDKLSDLGITGNVTFGSSTLSKDSTINDFILGLRGLSTVVNPDLGLGSTSTGGTNGSQTNILGKYKNVQYDASTGILSFEMNKSDTGNLYLPTGTIWNYLIRKNYYVDTNTVKYEYEIKSLGKNARGTTKLSEIFGDTSDHTLTMGVGTSKTFSSTNTINDIVQWMNDNGATASISSSGLSYDGLNLSGDIGDWIIDNTSQVTTPGLLAKNTYTGKLELKGTSSTDKIYVSDSSVTDFVAGRTYYLKDAADLNKLAELVNNGKKTYNVTFILENDIDMSGVTNFTPIEFFEGEFYGNGHVISNLTINSSNTYVALFGYVDAALIQDVGLVDVNITNQSSERTACVGALVASLGGNATVKNVYATGNITDNKKAYMLGGLIGEMAQKATLIDSYSSVNIVSNGEYVGGLAGSVYGTIEHSYSTGDVTGAEHVGGIAGTMSGTITSVYATGNIKNTNSNYSVGGLVGLFSRGTLTQSYFSGNVNSHGMVGGVIGSITDPSFAFISDVIFNSDNIRIGVGSGPDDGITGKTLSEMQNQSIMEGYGFTQANGWKYVSGHMPTIGNTNSSTTNTLNKNTKVSDLFDGSTSSQSLTLNLSSGKTTLTFNSTDTVQDIINKLAENGVEASVSSDGVFSAKSNDTSFSISGALAEKLFGGSIPAPTTSSSSSGSLSYVGNTVKEAISPIEVSEDVLISSFNPDAIGNSITLISTDPMQQAYFMSIDETTTIGDVLAFFVSNTNAVSDVQRTGTTISMKLNGGYSLKLDNNSFTSSNFGGCKLDLAGLLSILQPTATTTTKLQEITGRYDGITSKALHTISLTNNGTNYTIQNFTFTGSDTVQDVLDKLNSIDGIKATFIDGKLSVESIYSDLAFATTQGDNLSAVLFGGTIPSPTSSGGTTGKVYVSSLDDFVAGSTYYIKSAADLNKLAELVNDGKNTKDVTFILENDIDMSGVTNFTPIGVGNSQVETFYGTFYGNGHVIKNLTINNTSGRPMGLFGQVEGATIEDLGFENVNIKGSGNVGALIGADTGVGSDRTTVKNVYVNGGTVESTSTYSGNAAGGLVGWISSGIDISYSYSDVDVISSTTAGGLVGHSASCGSTIDHSFALGNVTSTGGNAGGLVGTMGPSSKITNSFAMGDVKGTENVGGLAGYLASATVSNSYSTGKAYGGTANGGFVGTQNSSTFTNNAYNADTGLSSISGSSNSGINARTLSDLQNQSTMQALGFTAANGWVYTDDLSPHFGNMTGSLNNSTIYKYTGDTISFSEDSTIGDLFQSGSSGGSTTGKVYVSTLDDFVAGNTYYLKDAADLNKLAELVNNGKSTSNVTFILENDIDMSGKTFTPIGRDEVNNFRGTFYGNGHVISNFNIKNSINSTDNNIGLFGATRGATIRDVIIKDVTIRGDSLVGALIGYAMDTNIINCSVENSTIGAVDALHVGALVGWLANSTVQYSHAENNSVTAASYVGGLIGYAYGKNLVEKSYVLGGTVRAYTQYAGGLIGGALYNLNISDAYIKGGLSITGAKSGGLFGDLGGGVTVQRSYANTSSYGNGGLIAGYYNGGSTFANVHYAYSSGAKAFGNNYSETGITQGLPSFGSIFSAENGWYASSDGPSLNSGVVENHGITEGGSSSYVLTITDENGVSENLTFAADDKINKVINELKTKGIIAAIENGKFTVSSSQAWTLSGEVANKLFGNNANSYSGEFVYSQNPPGDFLKPVAPGTVANTGFIDSVLNYSTTNKVYVSEVDQLEDGKTYYIKSKEDLIKLFELSNDRSNYPNTITSIDFVLDADIDMAGVTGLESMFSDFDSYGGWYSGTFYGNGHTISNLSIEGGGLFGTINGGAIRDLALENMTISADSVEYGANIGSLVNYIYLGDVAIDNVYVSGLTIKDGTSSSSDLSIGGLVGSAASGAAKIYNSYVKDVDVYKKANYFGGLIGSSTGLSNYSEIYNSFVDNVQLKVSATNSGLFGGSSQIYVYDSYAINSNISNLLGEGTGAYAGLTRVYSINGSTIKVYDTNGAEVTGVTAAKLADKTYMQSLGFTTDHGWSYSDTAPIFETKIYSNSNANDRKYVSDIQDGDLINSLGNVLYIKSADDLMKLSELMSNYDNNGLTEGMVFILENDIDMSGKTFTPIGSDASSPNYITFQGMFDGQGHVIKNITFSYSEDIVSVGLFAATDGAIIQNVGLENITINSSVAHEYYGGLVGFAENTKIYNSYVTGNVSFNNLNIDFYFGGLVGEGYNLNIDSSYVDLDINLTEHQSNVGATIGGLIGSTDSSVVSNSYSAGSIYADVSSGANVAIGGIAGATGQSIYTNIYSSMDIEGEAPASWLYVGGFFGTSGDDNVSRGYYSGTFNLTNTTNLYAGALLGYHDGGTTFNNIVYNSAKAYDAVGSGTATLNNVVAKSLSDMRNQSVMESLGFNAQNGWYYSSGSTPQFVGPGSINKDDLLSDLYGNDLSFVVTTVDGKNFDAMWAMNDTSTVQHFMDYLETTFGISSEIVDGKLTLTSDTPATLSGVLIEKMFGSYSITLSTPKDSSNIDASYKLEEIESGGSGGDGGTTTITERADENTTVGQLFGDSNNHTITVDGTDVTFSSSDTIGDILQKLWDDHKIHGSIKDGVISLDANDDHVLTGDLTEKLFGSATVDLIGSNGGASDAYTMERSEDGSGDGSGNGGGITTTKTMTEETLIGDLFGDSNSHTFTINGEDITLGADKTVQDLIDALEAKGYEVSVTDGKLLIGSNGYEEFTVSGDLAEKVLAKTGTITSDYKTQEVTLSESSRMEDIFWDDQNHTFVINKASGGSPITITLGKDDTIQTLFDKLKENDIVASISDGKLTFKSNYKWSASGDIADKIINAFDENITYFDVYDSHELNEYTGHQTVSQMLNAGETLVAGNRYHIASVQDLQALATFVNNKGLDTTDIDFVLDGDIDLASVSNFVPIGSTTNAFKGNFHGNGHTISDLKINSTSMLVGLFGQVDGATIKDVNLKDVNITGGAYTGALVGQVLDNSEIINCYASGSVQSNSDQVGGLVGALETSIMKNSYSTANVSGNGNVGGLIGYLGYNASLENSYATGDVTATSYWVGGLIGGMSYGGTIKNAYATGDVNAKNAKGVGGLVGLIESSTGCSYTLDTVYSTGRVYGNQYTGALIGWRKSTSATVSNAVYNTNLEIAGIGSGSTSGVTGKTFVEMQNQAIMQGLGFTAAKGWKYTPYNTPYLGNISVEENGGTRTVSNVDEFRAGDTYYITTKDDLIVLSNFLKNGEDTTGVKFILNNDIDMSGINFAPIGSSSNTFRGDFYGNGHSIDNLTINSYDDNSAGLFGVVVGGHIQDLSIKNATVAGEKYVGILAGYIDENSTVENVYTTGNITDGFDVGGLVGSNRGTIISSYSTATVSGRGSVGGLVGDNNKIAVIKKSYATGNVLSGVNAGGLVGFNSGRIETSYATGNTQASTYAGGFVGVNQGYITNSYSTGIALEGTYLGGFVGYMESGDISGGSVYNKSTKLNAAGRGSANNVTGLAYNEMWNQEKMESLGFTADKGWLYADKLTPYLNSNVSLTNGGKVYVSQVDSFVSGEVFYISTEADLNKLAELVNNGALTIGVTFVLENDIVMSGSNFTSIGNSTNAFQGTFSGNGNTISNLTISSTSSNVGLFGYTSGAVIRDVALKDVNISAANNVGALVGHADDGTEIINSYSTGSVTGTGDQIGGLIGDVRNSNIYSSYSSATVNGKGNVGGLIGCMTSVSQDIIIENSFATGDVIASGSDVGGLVGAVSSWDGSSITPYHVTVKNSYATGNVTSSGEYVGGLVGLIGRDVAHIFDTVYSTGNVSGSSSVGALVGLNDSTLAKFTNAVYNSSISKPAVGSGSSLGIKGLSINDIQDQSIMESYGFTSDKGWIYYEGKTPMLQDRDKSSGNSYSVDVSLDTALWMLGDASISKNIAVVVNGNTYEKYFNENDTVEDVMNWLNGISDINVSFDESNSTFTVTSDYEDLALSGGLTNILFGGSANREEGTEIKNTESQDLMKPGDYEEITEDTTIKALLNSNNSSVIGYIDDSGNYVTETFDADQTVGDVMDYLETQGFEVSLVNGVFTAVKKDGAKTDLLGAIGSALKGSDGTVISEGSGFVSDILSSTVGVTADGSTKLSALGVDSGKISIKSGSGAIVQTLEIDNNMTINDLASMLSNYGFTLSINNGKVTVTAKGDNTLVNGTSNLVSKLKLDTWTKNNEKLAGDSTLSEMGFSQGASLGVIVNGKNMPNLTFMANDTLDTIISRLKAYGIEASIDADGKFTAKADSSFILTGELGSYLTQNSANGYEEFANGYKSENPIEIGGTITKLTEDTLIGDLLGTGEGGILRLTLDGDRVIDLAYNANDTVKDIMVDLEGYGIKTEINDGVLTAISQDRTYRFSGDIGDALSGDTPMYDDISTGYVSKDLGYETVGTATLDSTLKELGISAGQIHIMDSNNNIVTTLDVDESFTVSQVKAMLMPYGLDLTMDSNGSITVTTNNGYKISDGTSNMVSKMGLTNWNMSTEKLNLNTTIAQMGFANGADLNLFLDGAVQNILSFDANQTLQDVIFALSAFGINASVDANGKFTATSDTHTFVMSNSLGSFLTKGTSGYTNFDSAYQTDKTLTEDFDYVTSSSSKLEYQENMTLDSTLESLGFKNGGNVIVSLDGQTHYTLSFLASDTVQDVVYALSAYGIDATVDNNGQFFAESVNNEFILTGNLGSYLVSGGMYQNEDTGYQSGELGYETIEKVTNDTKLSDLGVMRGDINIIKDGKLTGSTINITDDTTVGQLFNAIKVYGMNGSIKTNDAGETYIEIAADSNTYLADGTSNIVSGLGLVSVRQGDYKAEDVIYWEDETDSGLITEDMLLSDFDKNGYIAQGSLIFETGTGDEAVEHIINIASDETVGSLLQKLNNAGVTAVLDDGVIKINAGIDGITFKGGTSGLVNTIGLDIENVDVFASSSSALTYEGDVAYSAANFANGDTKLSVVNVTNGEMNFFVDGIKCTVQVNSEDTFADFFAKVSSEVANRTGLTLKAGFLNKSGEIVVNPTDAENTGVVAFEVEGEHELVIGSTIDTTNFATIANLNKAGYNEVVGSRALYRVNVNSKITESGLFRDGDITEGTFKIGDAEFTIDSNTTLNSLIEQINKSQTAYATAYWDTLSGTMVIQSTLTGASLINIEAGTSNFTDILGFTEEKNGVSALVTDNQTLGKNAIISINGTKVTASSNVITSEVSKIKGLTINLKNVSEGETVTITVERDDEAIYNAVSETIDAYNAMMEALNKELSNKETLGNQALLKLMRNNLKRLMTSSLTGDYYYKNLAAIGITTGAAQDSITLDVTALVIDKDQFLEALDTDDDAVKKLLVGTQANPGIFLQANNIVESSIKSTGYFNSMAESLTRSINNIEKKITQANEDIENYRTKLERNFQNMESAISSMQNSYSAFLNKIMS